MKKLLIVDDSFFIRHFLSEETKKIKNVTVAATASNGVEALKILQNEDIDLISLDIKMPEMDGFETLKKMRQMGIEVPVLIVSSLTEENSVMAVKALELGAVDVLCKYSPDADHRVKEIGEDFREKISELAEIDFEKKQFKKESYEPDENKLKKKLASLKPELLIIGGSTGAPQILHFIVSSLPADLTVPVVIIQHMEVNFLKGFAKHLNEKTSLNVRFVTSSEELKPGNIYIPGKKAHALFRKRKNKKQIRLKSGEPVSGAVPSIDVSFENAAEVFGKNVIAVILTGMGQDGAAGIDKLHQAGALCLGQDKETSAVYGMPGQAAARGALDMQAAGDEIPAVICDWLEKTTP